MKKTIEKKLLLNKETVSNLGNRELKEIKGGSELISQCDARTRCYDCLVESINACIEVTYECTSITPVTHCNTTTN